jgi:hypothetical protein
LIVEGNSSSCQANSLGARIMRRWQEFGFENPTFAEILKWRGTTDENGLDPRVYISFPKKVETFQIVNLGWGTNDTAIYIQQVGVDSMSPAPASDCPAFHFNPGFSPYGAMSPLPVFLYSGFFTKDFQLTPKILNLTLSRPSKNG